MTDARPEEHGRGAHHGIADRYDVFLSYNSSERPVIERIAVHLRDRCGLQPWWDRWMLTGGGKWQEEIVEGLRSSGSCAVLVGPNGLGEWAREELAVAQDLAAKDRQFRLFMVLLPGAPELSDPSVAFLRTRTWVDLRSGANDGGALQDLVSAITGAPRRRQSPTIVSDVCPYQGLKPFGEDDAPYFFGRDADVAMVVEKLRTSRLLVVLGPSGSGKSSLLRAGLVPAIRRGALAGSESWPLRVFTPGPRPLNALAANMTLLCGDAPMQRTLDQLLSDAATLDLAASVALADDPQTARVLLVIDQFEELFSLCPDEEERARFIATVLYAATIPGGRVVVAVGMRADFYPRCGLYPDLRMLVAEHQFLLGPLAADGLRAVIEEPARHVGLELEAGLVDTIVDDVGDRPGTLPLLEHVLLELWQRRRGAMLTLEAYRASGGVDEALAQRAEAAYDALPSLGQELARRALLRLVQPGEGAEDTRRRAPVSELVSGTLDEPDLEAVLSVLAEHRLVTTAIDEATGNRVVDITHEALIRGWPRLRRWIAEDRDNMRAQRHLTDAAAEWHRRGRHDEDLYAGARLAYWKERPLAHLTAVERAFVNVARRREAKERAARQRRIRLALGGVGLSLSLVATVALVGLRSVAAQRTVAESRQLAAESLSLLDSDPDRGIAKAADAYERSPTDEAQRALRQASMTAAFGSRVLARHKGSANSASFSPDGTQVVTAGDDGTVLVWKLQGNRNPTVLAGHEGPVVSAAFSPDGSRVVSGGEDGTVRIWDPADRTEETVLSGADGAIVSAAMNPDGTAVVGTSTDSAVLLWNIERGGKPDVLMHVAEGNAAFSPDGTQVVVAAWRGEVLLLDLMSGGEPTVLGNKDIGVESAAFSADGAQVVSGWDDGKVRVWNLAERTEPTVLASHPGVVQSAVFSPDAARVVAAGDDGKIRVWDVEAGTEPIVLPSHPGIVHGAAFSPDGKQAVSAGDDGKVRIWNLAAQRQLIGLGNQESTVQRAAFSSDATQVVSASDEGALRIWRLDDSDEPVLLAAAPGVRDIAFTLDGNRAISAEDHGITRIWTVAKGSYPTVLESHSEVHAAAFSPDGRRAVTAGDDGKVRIWDLEEGGDPTVLASHRGEVNTAAFSPDGTRVVTAGDDGKVRIWDLVNGDPTVLASHRGEITIAAFSPDGTRVVTAGDDDKIRIWDLVNGGDPTVLASHSGEVNSAAFSPDGTRVVTGGDDGTARIWNLAEGGEPTVLAGGAGRVHSAAFIFGGDRLITAGDDHNVEVWDCLYCGIGFKALVERVHERLPDRV